MDGHCAECGSIRVDSTTTMRTHLGRSSITCLECGAAGEVYFFWSNEEYGRPLPRVIIADNRVFHEDFVGDFYEVRDGIPTATFQYDATDGWKQTSPATASV